MTQQMGPALWRVQAGPFERLLHDAAHRGRSSELAERRPCRREEVPGGTRRARLAEVGRQGPADLSQEGQSLTRPAFAANGQLPGAPIDIVEGQGGDFPGPEAEPSQQAQHGIIPLADRRRPVAVPQQGSDLVFFQRPRDGDHFPVGYRRHGGSEVGGRPASHVQEAQEGPKAGDGALR